MKYLDWAKDHADEARDALVALWDSDLKLEDKLARFMGPLPPDLLSSPSSRLQIASFLLMADPDDYVIYRPTPFKKAADIVDFPRYPDTPEIDIYKHALAFTHEVLERGKQRGIHLRDLLDAQSVIWAVTQNNPEKIGVSPDEVEALLRLRGDKSSVWWVNQGWSYEEEVDRKLVQAPLESRGGYDLQHWKNVELLRTGDLIVHHANGAIRSISEVTKRAVRGPRKWRPDAELGRYARTKYWELADPIVIRDIDASKRTPEAGPFDVLGTVKQVYLVPVSVGFSDWLRDAYRDRWTEGSPWAPKKKPTWLFQANPRVWDVEAALASMDEGDTEDFSVSRFKSEIAIGDRVLLWKAGDRSGIYGIGQIIGEIFERGEDEEHFTSATDEVAVPWRLTRKLDPPILRIDLLKHPVLSGLSVISAPQGTNFRVTDEQWLEIQKLLDDVELPEDVWVERSLEEITEMIASQGLVIDDRTLRRFHVSLKTRGFVILSGISGTGKTWISELYADAVGAKYLLVPVAPNWTTNEDLLGYLNPLDDVYYDTVFSQFLRDAAEEYDRATKDQREPQPYLLALDEMNLARVEYYFAKFLSAMEVRSRRGTSEIELAPNQSIQLTPNLLFVGTVNIDETTHGFADKVFDRAQLLELSAPRSALATHIGQASYGKALLAVYDAVSGSKPFAFRVVDEIKAYVAESEALGVEWPTALDEQVLQKVLPKLNGADPAIRFSLESVIDVAKEHEFDLTRVKAERMLDDYDRDGFTSYF